MTNENTKKSWLMLIPVAMLISLVFFYGEIGEALFGVLSTPTQTATFYALKLFYKSIMVGSTGALMSDDMLMKQCLNGTGVGILGMGAFICVFTFFVMREPKKFTPAKWSLAFVLGMTLMFVLNVVRSAASFSINHRFHEMYSATEAKSHAEPYLNNLGWPIYSLGLCLFFFVLLRTRGNFQRIENQA